MTCYSVATFINFVVDTKRLLSALVGLYAHPINPNLDSDRSITININNTNTMLCQIGHLSMALVRSTPKSTDNRPLDPRAVHNDFFY